MDATSARIRSREGGGRGDSLAMAGRWWFGSSRESMADPEPGVDRRGRRGAVVGRDSAHVGDELIAAPGYGNQVAPTVLVVERAPHRRNRLREAVVLDDGRRPELFHQGRARDEDAGMRDEIDKRVEHLAREPDSLAGARSPARVQAEFAELVNQMRIGGVHR